MWTLWKRFSLRKSVKLIEFFISASETFTFSFKAKPGSYLNLLKYHRFRRWSLKGGLLSTTTLGSVLTVWWLNEVNGWPAANSAPLEPQVSEVVRLRRLLAGEGRKPEVYFESPAALRFSSSGSWREGILMDRRRCEGHLHERRP